MPRILIAIVLAITISKPLEIKLFDGTITKKLGQTESTYNSECENDFNKQRLAIETQKQKLKTEMTNSKNTIYSNDPIYKDLVSDQGELVKSQTELNKKISQNTYTIGVNTIRTKKDDIVTITYTALAKSKMAENTTLSKKLSDNVLKVTAIDLKLEERKTELIESVRSIEKGYTTQIAAIQKQINDLDSRRVEILSKCRTESASDKDILSRLRALGELKEFGNSVWAASLLITLLFILLETAPVTMKLLSSRGPYDEILDRINVKYKLHQATEINRMREEMKNTEKEEKMKFESKLKEEQIKFENKLKMDVEMVELINETRKNIVREKLIKWEEIEMEKNKKVISDDEIRGLAEKICRERNQGSDELNWLLAEKELKDGLL